MADLLEARTALRLRQGPGARWDSPDAPAVELDWARRGTAYFARLLNELPDSDLDKPSLVVGWSRRHVVAQVGYHARALTRLTACAAAGLDSAAYPSEDERLLEVESGATLPSRALRALFHHAAVHLDVEWRELSAEAWDARLPVADGVRIAMRQTPFMRARELCLRSVDLNASGSLVDFPPALLDKLLEQAVRDWDGVPLTLVLEDRDGSRIACGGETGRLVAGRVAGLLRWLSGRGARGLSYTGELPLPPVLAR